MGTSCVIGDVERYFIMVIRISEYIKGNVHCKKLLKSRIIGGKDIIYELQIIF